MSNIKLIEITSDLGGRVPGSSLGADAVRIASYKNINDKYFYSRFDNGLYTLINVSNKLYHIDPKYPKAKRIESLYPVNLQICDSVANSILNNNFTIVISGDHSTAGGTISGMKKAFPDRRLGVI